MRIHLTAHFLGILGIPASINLAQRVSFLTLEKISNEEMFNKIDNVSTLTKKGGNGCSFWHFGVSDFLEYRKNV